MTNFAACRSRRSFAKQNAIRETQSRATTRAGQSVISERLPFRSNGNQTGEWNCGTSVYSSNSSSTLSRTSSYQRQASSTLSTRSNHSKQYSAVGGEHRCCKQIGHQTAGDHLTVAHLNEDVAHLKQVKQLNDDGEQLNGGGHSNSRQNGNQTDQTSVLSLNYLVRSQKCALCKEPIKFFREEFICGHAYHGDCLWRFEKLNPTYDPDQCPKNCMRRIMMIKRTRSIESRSSSSSSSSSSS